MNGHKFKNYKKMTLVLSLIAMVALVVTAAAFSLKKKSVAPAQTIPYQHTTSYYNPKISSSQEIPNTPQPSPASVPERYLITVCDGKIGVYKNEESSPFLTSPVEVYLLPQADIELLQKGIVTNSFAEVKAILEDYR